MTNVVNMNVKGKELKLIRIRNPWGDDVEWNGAWSDKAKEWNSFDEQQKKDIGFKIESDGEFW